MVAAAAVVTVTGTVTGTLSALDDDGGSSGTEAARPSVTRSFRPVHETAPPSPSPSPSDERSGSASPAPQPSPSPTSTPTKATGEPSTAAPAARLYRHPGSQVLDWVAAHPDDPRQAVIADRIAAQP
ncbi:endoglucanase, partial [Streptomyces sp. TRM76130]|nr:endoglucanase [Streptomyces sp. TRM76130]